LRLILKIFEDDLNEDSEDFEEDSEEDFEDSRGFKHNKHRIDKAFEKQLI